MATLKHFNQFIEKIPKSIEYLERRIQENGNELFQLSFNDEEIIVVTAFFISIIGTQEEEKLIPIIEAYIGESWRYHFDGKWALCPENKDRAFLKPVIYWGDGSPRHWPWEEIVEIIKSLNGNKVFILGNHDGMNLIAALHVLKIKHHSILDLKIKDSELGVQPITLCHYPMLSWNQSHRGAWNIYGHHHGSKKDIENGLTYRHLDVSVENQNYEPISFAEVKTKITQQYMERT
jgi:calcineurin-like phosphoesterase family protein